MAGVILAIRIITLELRSRKGQAAPAVRRNLAKEASLDSVGPLFIGKNQLQTCHIIALYFYSSRRLFGAV